MDKLQEKGEYAEQHYEKIKKMRAESRGEVAAEVKSEVTQQTLSITAAAATSLTEMLGTMPRAPGQALRLTVAPTGGVRLTLDSRRLGDALVQHMGMTVMLVRTPMPPQLLGATLDVKITPGGPNFTLTRDQAAVESALSG